MDTLFKILAVLGFIGAIVAIILATRPPEAVTTGLDPDLVKWIDANDLWRQQAQKFMEGAHELHKLIPIPDGFAVDPPPNPPPCKFGSC